MAELDILNIDVTQMQRLVVSFSPLASLADTDTIVFVWSDGIDVYEEEFAEIAEEVDNTARIMIGRLETQFPMGVTIDASIVVYDVDNEVKATGDSFIKEIFVRKNNNLMIQQAIYDILKEDVLLDIYDREINILDNYFVPNDTSDGECLSCTMPIVRVARPTTISVNTIGDKAMSMEHEIELKISDIAFENETNNVSHLYEIANDIIFKLKGKEHLGLRQVGLSDKSLEFEFDRTGDINDGDNLNSISIFINVIQFRQV